MPECAQILTEALDYGVEKLAENLERLGSFPHTTDRGRWRQSEHGRWTAGFWVGALWLAFLYTGEGRWADAAERWARRMEARKDDRATHDMGMLFQPSFVRGWRITGRAYYREVALAACASHASRFNAAGQFLPAWDVSEDPIYAGRTIVDTAMNLPILLWGAREAGQPSWDRIARAVAATIRRHHLRADGSTYHVVDFDPNTGQPTAYTTHQGYAPWSCWARGQAWAFYGFTLIYKWTDDPADLDSARRMADYFLAHLPADLIPPWDFQAPRRPNEPRDSAAGAIAASGLLELARVLGEIDGTRYREVGLALLEQLFRQCASRGQPEQEGILLHATVDLPHGSAIDESTMYGDHFFLEALLKVVAPRHWSLIY